MTEQSSGLLTNDSPSGEKQIKDVGRPSREKLHISSSLSPGSEDKANAGRLPQLTVSLGCYVSVMKQVRKHCPRPPKSA